MLKKKEPVKAEKHSVSEEKKKKEMEKVLTINKKSKLKTKWFILKGGRV